MDIIERKTTMNQPQTLEWHQLDLRYADIRIHTQKAINHLVGSIQSHGLLNPIVVVPLGGYDCSVIDKKIYQFCEKSMSRVFLKFFKQLIGV
jgi:hypothetical protein